MNLLDLLFRRQPKNSRASLKNALREPEAISQTMDAGRIHDVLRAAESGDMRDFFSLVRDIVSGHTHTLTEFGKRKLAVIAETQSFPPADPDDPVQVARAKEIGSELELLPCWNTGMLHLLDSTLYPVSLLKKIYRPSSRPGWRYELADLIPVPYHQLDYTTGTLRIRDVNEDGLPTGTFHEPDSIRYVIHRGHLLTSCPDTWGGPMRAILFWWLFSTQNRDWWARFLERFGSPFLEGTYDKNDDTSRTLLERAFSGATRLFGIAVPDDASVKIHQANTSQGGNAFMEFHGTANREISKLILGQTLSAEGQNLGLGGGQAGVQDGVRGDLRQFDTMMLAFTVRTQILKPLCEINGWTGEPPRIAWGGDDVEDLDTLSQVLERLATTGIHLTDEGIDSVSKRMALPLVRVPSAPVAPPVGRLSALAAPDPRQAKSSDAIDKVAAAGSGGLSDAFIEMFSPLGAIVAESSSLADLESRLLNAVPTLSAFRASELAQAVLVTASANSARNFREL